MRLLLISNSTNAGENYLYHAKTQIKKFLGEKPVQALFIPYAGITITYEDYETREMRIDEYIKINTDIYVAGLREGTMFLIENSNIQLIGTRNVRIFKYGQSPLEINPGNDLQFLMH